MPKSNQNKGVAKMNMERVVNASVEVVWKAWTDPEMIKKWFGPEGFTIPICEVDARKGGAIRLVMEDSAGLIQQGSRYPMKGTFTEVLPQKRLVYTSNAVDDTTGAIQLEGMTEVTFEKIGNTTKVTVSAVINKAAPGTEMMISGMEMGWGQSLDKLVAMFEK